MTDAPAGRFEIGRVLSRTMGVLSRNFPVMALLALVLSGLPNLVFVLIAGGASTSTVATAAALGAMGPAVMIGGLVSLITGTLLQAALINVTVGDLSGRPTSLGDGLRTAVKHILPLIGIAILSALAMIVGLILLIVPGIIVALALCVAAPARVIEGTSVIASLGRSAALTRSHRGAILLLFLVVGVVAIVLQLVSTPLIAIPAVGRVIVSPLLQSVFALIGSAMAASIYFELRTIKEGVGVEALAAAFD